MHIRLINPNSTASMTAQALESALRVRQRDTEVSAVNPIGTPVSIEGGADEAVAVPGLLDEIRKGERLGIDAYVVACFDDPGLHAAREVARGPVIGICQAAVQVAMTISRRFSIITTLPRSIPIIEDLVSHYGAERHCRRVRAINLPVLGLEGKPGGSGAATDQRDRGRQARRPGRSHHPRMRRHVHPLRPVARRNGRTCYRWGDGCHQACGGTGWRWLHHLESERLRLSTRKGSQGGGLRLSAGLPRLVNEQQADMIRQWRGLAAISCALCRVAAISMRSCDS